MNERLKLQIALLSYFLHAKTIRNAAKREEFKGFDRKEIRLMKDALWRVGFLQDNPSMKTSGVIYRTTTMGRQQLRLLMGETTPPTRKKRTALPKRSHMVELQP